MKKIVFIVLAVVLSLSLAPAVAFAHPDGIIDGELVTELQNGQHFTLNIIGVKNDKGKNANMGNDLDSANGNVIFVDMTGKTKISLSEGEDYAVLDKNGTDGEATLQLPPTGLDPYVIGDKGNANTISNYSVFVRPLGTPGGYTTITTCADVLKDDLADWLNADAVNVLNDAADMGGYASIESVGQLITERDSGKSSFTNVTAELLTIVLKIEVIVEDVVVDTIYVRIPIFDDMLENEYWEYDNNNLKLLQVRFYAVGTDVSAGDGNLPALP